MFGFSKNILYLFVNTYNGDTKWLTMEDGQKLINEDGYWELDSSQAPFQVYD